MDANPLLGYVSSYEKSSEEDQKERSIKKVKVGDHDVHEETPMEIIHRREADSRAASSRPESCMSGPSPTAMVEGVVSYKSSLLNTIGSSPNEVIETHIAYEMVGANKEERDTKVETMSSNDLSYESSIERSPFGPLMLVKKPPIFKGKSLAAEDEMNQSSKARGSHFASLMDNNEADEDMHESQQAPSGLTKINSKEVGLDASPMKIVRVRDPLAGKNNQNRPTKEASQHPSQKGKSTKKDLHRNIDFSSKPLESSSIFNNSADHRKLMRDKEKSILQSMKIMEKQGIGTIDSFCTQAILPSSVEVNRAYAHIGVNNDAIHPLEPPDSVSISINSNSQKAAMEVDDINIEHVNKEVLGAVSQPRRDGLQDQPQ
ncbi:hypothetical protein RIF29_08768 [Crotalaria pallida]|uniref:Uncharacterized protein n=1 Tax=Crotalaria pallida TaxID=3830 RepID=A0AAN9FXL4_CROPI